MPIRSNRYEKRDGEEILNTLTDELLDQNENANPNSTSAYVHSLLYAVAYTIAQNQEESLQHVYESAYVEDASDEELTKKARNLGIVRRSATQATGVVTFRREPAPENDITIPSGTVVETLDVDPIQFETTEVAVIDAGTTTAKANVEAVEGGSHGNVGSNAISVIPSPPTQSLEVENEQPTGDPSLTDTNGDPLTQGQDREGDEELRQRILDSEATSEGPSVNGVELALQSLDDVVSAHVNTNQDSSPQDGLDPYQSEAIVYGGAVQDIARTLYETMSMTTVLRLQGGVHGEEESTTVYSLLLDQDISVPITRPTPLTFDVTMDVVHTNEYAGDVAAKDAIVGYVGGTRADDSTMTTQNVSIGDNVLVNEMENRVEDVRGVEYANVTLVDTDGDGTDDTTTDEDGVPVLEVGNGQVARVDADDITVNTTQRQ